MTDNLYSLESEFWQIGILPKTGASVAFGRVKQNTQWVDILRPTSPDDYDNASNCASFMLIPYSNRIKDAKFTFQGQDYQLRVNNQEGSASHGDVRKRAWTVTSVTNNRLEVQFDTQTYDDINFPFDFRVQAVFQVDQRDFVMEIILTNTDDQPFPAGFGHHPYFVRTDDVRIEIPCDQMFELTDFLATAPPVPIAQHLDFRTLRGLESEEINDLLTGRNTEKPIRLVYPSHQLEVDLYADDVFKHAILFTPQNKPFYALEPVTNTNDGFNLYEQGVEDTGVFVLYPGESKRGIFIMRYKR